MAHLVDTTMGPRGPSWDGELALTPLRNRSCLASQAALMLGKELIPAE